MKKSIYIVSTAFVLSLIFMACESSRFDSDLLQGTWEVAAWEIEETGEAINNKMDMQFGKGRAYSIDYGTQKEEGKFWISGEFLHTVEKGQSEKRVKLIRLDAQTLKFQMNRGGQMESVVLAKKQ